MPITVHCDSCQRELRVPDNLLGKLVKCPSCGHTFTAIEQDAVVEPVVSPAAATTKVQSADEPARPARRTERIEEDDDDDYERRPRSSQKPGKVQAIGIMMLIGGILAIFAGLGGLTIGILSCVCLAWPGTYYSLVLGIMATIKGSQILGAEGHKQAPPKGIAIMQIINIINGDIPNCVMGILSLVFLNEPETNRYFRGR
jgi:predicted Zn finger-like uncharacterized protein